MLTWTQTSLDTDKDNRALALAKVALGWADMTPEEQAKNMSALLLRAQEIKGVL